MYFDHCIVFLNDYEEAKKVVDLNLTASKFRVHKGQGTESYIFMANNAFLELLWVNPDDKCKEDHLKLYGRASCQYKLNRKIGFAFRGSSTNDDSNSLLKYSPGYSPELTIYAYKKTLVDFSGPLLLMLDFNNIKNNDHYTPEIRMDLKEEKKVWNKIRYINYGKQVIDSEKNYSSFDEICTDEEFDHLEIVIESYYNKVVDINDKITLKIINGTK